MSGLIGFIIRKPWMMLFASLLLIVVSGSGLRFFVIESDYEVFFDGTNARLQAHRQLEVEYGRKDAVRIGIAPRSGDVFDPAVLNIIKDLTQASWEIPYSSRVESLTNFQYTRSSDGEIVAGDLFEQPDQLSESALEQRKRFALSDPSVVNLSVNPQGSVAGVQVMITLPDDDSRATSTVANYTRDLLNQYSSQYPDVDFYLTGSILTNDAFFQASTIGTAKLIGLMLAIGLSIFALLLRSVSATVIAFCLIIGSTIIGLGLASWLRLPFTAFSASSLIIIIAVVIASSVHVLALLLSEMREGQNKRDALQTALTLNWKPVTLTTLTTVLGFLCLNFSDIPPSRYLGTTAALAVVGCLLLSFTLLPSLVNLLPIRVKAKTGKGLGEFWNQLGDFLSNNKLTVSVLVVLLCASTIPFIARNNINDSVLTYFNKNVDFRRDSDFLMENLFYFYSMDLSIPSGEENGINSPEYMRKVDQLVTWANAQPEVYNVLSFTNILKNINRAINDGDESWYRLPDDRNLAAEFMLMYEMSLPFGLDLNNQLNVDKSAAKIIIGFHDVKGDQLIEFDQRVGQWMEENFPPEMRAIPSGPSLMFANIWGDAARSNLLGMGIAVLLISAIIAMAMRSVSLGALCLIPNLLPILMVFGFWGLVNGRIDMGASVVAIIGFGIVVDDSIHFISKFRYAIHNLKYTAAEAIRYSLRTVGQAIVISTLALMSGFAVLAQSDFALNGKVGMLTCALLLFALVLDLLFLPILLAQFYKNSNRPLDQSEPVKNDKKINSLVLEENV